MEYNMEDRKWYLAAKFLTDGLDDAEQSEWNALAADREFQEEFSRVSTLWEKAGGLPYGAIDTATDWKAVMKEIRKTPKRGVWLPVWRYAAVISLCIVAVSLFLVVDNEWFSKTGGNAVTTIAAPAGSKTLVTLPDSSTVWLNAGSRISFDRAYGIKNRNIRLTGEAFFDVIKSKVPFNVHTEQYEIAVLGTAFNVKAYPEDEKVTTTLVRGSLKVKHENIDGKVEETLLKPNEKFTWSKNRGTSSSIMKGPPAATAVKKVNTDLETSWKDGWLAIEGESLDELAIKIQRLHDVTIHFEDEELKNYRYTGRIKQLSLEQVLKALSLTSPIEFSIDEKNVTLRENKATKSKYQSLQTP